MGSVRVVDASRQHRLFLLRRVAIQDEITQFAVQHFFWNFDNEKYLPVLTLVRFRDDHKRAGVVLPKLNKDEMTS